MKGRRTPTRVREITGKRNTHRVNLSEPEFEAVRVNAPPPAWLSGAAVAEWERVVPHLARLGLVQVVDVMSLAAYCSAVAHWEAAERSIAAEGSLLTLRDDKGVVKSAGPSPYVALAVKWMDKIRQFSGEFGFTPSSRGRIEVEKAGSGDALDFDAIRRELAELEGADGKIQ